MNIVKRKLRRLIWCDLMRPARGVDADAHSAGNALIARARPRGPAVIFDPLGCKIDLGFFVARIAEIKTGLAFKFRADAAGAAAMQLHRSKRGTVIAAGVTRSQPLASGGALHQIGIYPVLDGGLAHGRKHPARITLARRAVRSTAAKLIE